MFSAARRPLIRTVTRVPDRHADTSRRWIVLAPPGRCAPDLLLTPAIPVQAPGGNFITHFIASWMDRPATRRRHRSAPRRSSSPGRRSRRRTGPCGCNCHYHYEYFVLTPPERLRCLASVLQVASRRTLTLHFAALAWPAGPPLQTRAALCRTAKNCYYADRPPLVPPTRRRRLLLPTLYASRRDALAQQGPPPPQHYRQRVRAAAARRNEETMPPVQAPGGNFITHFIASWMENSDATEKRMIDHTLRLHAGCLRMRQSWTEAQHTGVAPWDSRATRKCCGGWAQGRRRVVVVKWSVGK